MLYPQNGGRIVAIDFMTSLHPMYTFCSFIKLYNTHFLCSLVKHFCWGYFAPTSFAAPGGGGQQFSAPPPLVTPLGLTREHCGRPTRNMTRQKTPTTAIFRRPVLSSGNSSTTAVTIVSTMANWLSTPSVKSITKKRTDQAGAAGIIAMPSGNATNARPGPAPQPTHWHHLYTSQPAVQSVGWTQPVVQPVGWTMQMSAAKRCLSGPTRTLMTSLGWRAAKRLCGQLTICREFLNGEFLLFFKYFFTLGNIRPRRMIKKFICLLQPMNIQNVSSSQLCNWLYKYLHLTTGCRVHTLYRPWKSTWLT